MSKNTITGTLITNENNEIILEPKNKQNAQGNIY